MKDITLLKDNGVDVDRGIELFGDLDTYNEMLEDFIQEAEKKMGRINSFKEEEDLENYSILVHSLKGDAKYFGFTKLGELAYQHELESKSGNLDFVQENYLKLDEEFKRIMDILKRYLE